MVFQAAVNIIFDRQGKVDPVTRGLEILVEYVDLDVDVPFWSQHVSFIMVGVIVVTNMRSFLLQLMKVFRAVSSSVTSSIIVLLMAMVMGMYFVSSVLLMRMSLPLEYRTILTTVLGNLQFSFYHRWFDVIFLVSGLSSIFLLYVTNQQQPRASALPADIKDK